MVFTQAETNTFFTGATQLAIPVATLAGLVLEGINEVEDLEEFEDDDFDTIMTNLRKPTGTMPDPNHQGRGAAPLVPILPYVFGAKSLKRIKIASLAVRYYNATNREIDATNMHYTNYLKSFHEQWQSLLKKGKDDEPDTPCITRSLPIMKWTESFTDFLSQVIGHRDIPLAYLVRENDTVPVPAPPLINNRPYSAEHESVEGELIARASFTHEKYKDDNARLYGFIEEATRSTQYAASIRTFSRRKDGREAWKALNAQFAGKDKWQQEIKAQENFIYTRVWKGNTTYSLESFVNQHRNAHVRLQRCAEQVPHQLPNSRSRVIHLIDAIQCTDPALQAAIAHVKSNDNPGGMMSDFEETAAYILQFDPVSKKRPGGRNNGNRQQQQIALVDQSLVGDGQMKKNRGKTGVELRYHKPESYRKLTDEQKQELKEWRQNNPKSNKRKGGGGGGGHDKRHKTTKQQIIAALQEMASEEEKEAEGEITKEWIISAIREANSTPPLPPAPPAVPAPKPKSATSALQRIIQRAKGN